MRKNLILCLLTTVLTLVICGCAGDDNPVGPADTGKTILETPVDASNNDVILTIDDKIEIVIPQGVVPPGTILKIVEDPKISIMKTMEYKILKVYNVTLGSYTTFDKPLKITLKFDPTTLDSNSLIKELKGAYFNEAVNRWSMYSNSIVDSKANTITFETNHLTPLGLAEFVSSGGYQHKFVSNHFCIYYTYAEANKVMSNESYCNNQGQPWHITEGEERLTPFYIQDLSHWLEEAYCCFKDVYKFDFRDTNIINVYVKQLSGADGEYGSISGAVYINNIMTKPERVKETTFPALLQSVAAHELLHYVQDIYYVMNKGKTGLWWLEATASNADLMVWGNQLSYPEAYCWGVFQNNANGSVLGYNISKSWDDCKGSPFHYLAGGFLTYMSFYDGDISLNIGDLIKIGGENFELSYIRTILNNYLTANKSTTLGLAYEKYVKWLFEANGKISLPYTSYSSVPNADNAVEFGIVMDENQRKITFNSQLPYLSARVLKIKSMTEKYQNACVKVLDLPDGMSAFLGKYENKKTVIVQELKKGDSLEIELPVGKNKSMTKEIVLINKSIDKNLIPNIEFELVAGIEITSILPLNANPGDIVTLKGIAFGNEPSKSSVTFNGKEKQSYYDWNDTLIKCTIPIYATSGDVIVTVNGKKSKGFYYEIGKTEDNVIPITLDTVVTGTFMFKLYSIEKIYFPFTMSYNVSGFFRGDVRYPHSPYAFRESLSPTQQRWTIDSKAPGKLSYEATVSVSSFEIDNKPIEITRTVNGKLCKIVVKYQPSSGQSYNFTTILDVTSDNSLMKYLPYKHTAANTSTTSGKFTYSMDVPIMEKIDSLVRAHNISPYKKSTFVSVYLKTDILFTADIYDATTNEFISTETYDNYADWGILADFGVLFNQ